MERRMNEAHRDTAKNALLHELALAAREEKAAVMHYTHAAILAAESAPAAARLFDELARAELAHYEELGQLLLYLSKSAPQAARSTWHNVFFAKSPHTGPEKHGDTNAFIQSALQNEQKAAANYRRLADVTRDDITHKLLLQIANEEIEHAAALTGLEERIRHS